MRAHCLGRRGMDSKSASIVGRLNDGRDPYTGAFLESPRRVLLVVAQTQADDTSGGAMPRSFSEPGTMHSTAVTVSAVTVSARQSPSPSPCFADTPASFEPLVPPTPPSFSQVTAALADLEELSREGLQAALPLTWSSRSLARQDNGSGGRAIVPDEDDAVMMQRAALNRHASADGPSCVATGCASEDEAALKDLLELERAGLAARWTR